MGVNLLIMTSILQWYRLKLKDLRCKQGRYFVLTSLNLNLKSTIMDDVEFSEEKEYDASLRKLTEQASADKKSFLSTFPIILGLAKD